MPSPKASIVVITYNQQDYIRDALESFVRQHTDFPFEVVIGDDCSTDGTPAILQEYAQKYSFIKLVLRKKNLGPMPNFVDTLKRAAGTYIALCEGDDYWIDPMKLQKQVDFFESHTNYALCFHPVKVVFEGEEEADAVFPEDTSGFTLKKLLQRNFIQTNAVMYRRQNYDHIPLDILPGDWYMHLYHAQFGKIGFINEAMSVYRRHANGIWQGQESEVWQKYGVAYLGMFTAIMDVYGDRAQYREIIEPSIIQMFQRLIAVDNNKGTHLVLEASQKYPASTELFIKRQDESLQRGEQELELRNWVIGRLMTDISRTMERANLVLRSKSFMAGYYTLHPWKAPRKVASVGKQKAMKLHHQLKQSVDLQRAVRQYEIFDMKLAGFENRQHKKIAVIIHLYYPDLWGYFAEHLSVLDSATFDLFVTLPKDDGDVESHILQRYPTACLLISPNRGRDVLPFLRVASKLPAKGYEYVLKLHSKKSKHWDGGDAWLRSITETLLPANAHALQEIVDALGNKETGIVGPSGHYVSCLVNYEPNKFIIRSALGRLKSPRAARYVDAYRHEYGFFAGTMFWARLDALDAILSSGFGPQIFDAEAGQVDATFAHAIERLLCIIPELENKKMYEADVTGVREIPYRTYNIPEWADVHIAKISREKPPLEKFERPPPPQ